METAPQGFGTWFQLYDYLVANGFANEQRVALIYPNDANAETIAETESTPEVKSADRELTFYMDEIKARAFDEMYERLPTKETVGILVEMLDTATKIVGTRSHVTPTREYLLKLPQRT